MAKRGRPGKGDSLGEDPRGKHAARQRRQVSLHLLAGTLTVQEASEALGVRASGFDKLRQQCLLRASALLAPTRRGFRRSELSQAQTDLEKLRHEVVQLKPDLYAQRI